MLWHKINCAGRKFYALHVNIEYLMTTIEPTNRTTQAPICFHLPISFRASFIFRYCLFYALFAFFIFIYLFIIYYGEYHLIEWDFSAVFFWINYISVEKIHRQSFCPFEISNQMFICEKNVGKRNHRSLFCLFHLVCQRCCCRCCLRTPLVKMLNENELNIITISNLSGNASSFFSRIFFSTIENAVLYWNTFTPHLFHLSLSVFLHRFWFDWLNLFKMSPIYNWMCVYVQTNDFAVLLFCQSLLFLVPLHVHHIPKWNVFILNRVDQLEFNWRRKKNAKTNSFQCSHTSTKKTRTNKRSPPFVEFNLNSKHILTDWMMYWMCKRVNENYVKMIINH